MRVCGGFISPAIVTTLIFIIAQLDIKREGSKLYMEYAQIYFSLNPKS